MTPRAWIAAAAMAACLLLLPRAFDPRLADLNLIFTKVDLMAFGGGFTTIPLIQREVVDRYQWITTREFIDGIAMGQITPGPIVITATFVGYRLGGLLGALLGTIAVFFPSFIIVMTLAPHYDRIKRSRYVQIMVRGIPGHAALCRLPLRGGGPPGLAHMVPHGCRLDRPLAESRLALGGWGGCRSVVAAFVSPHTTTGRKAGREDRRRA